MSTMTINLDLGDLGEHEADITYDGTRGHPGGFDEPPEHEDLWIEHIRVNGIDLLPLVADDSYLVRQLLDRIRDGDL